MIIFVNLYHHTIKGSFCYVFVFSISINFNFNIIFEAMMHFKPIYFNYNNILFKSSLNVCLKTKHIQ